MAAANNDKKSNLKLLMLHGYRQNGKAFRDKTGGLRHSLRSNADFVSLDAPHLIPAENGENNQERGWWYKDDNHAGQCDVELEQSLTYLDGVFREQGPFDGIFAFSQGGCLGAILCRIVSDQSLPTNVNKYPNIKFNFAILIAAYKSKKSQHDNYYNLTNKIHIPSLHVYGETDKVISVDRSESLTDYFHEPKIYKHSGGHFVPTKADHKNAIVNFFSSIE